MMSAGLRRLISAAGQTSILRVAIASFTFSLGSGVSKTWGKLLARLGLVGLADA